MPAYDPFHIFVTAEEFNETSKTLSVQGSRTQAMNLFNATVVCAAFSLELYFKCLVTLETGQTPRGHDLVQLFGQLSETARNELMKGGCPVPEAALAGIKQMLVAKYGPDWPGMPKFDFMWALETSRDAFERVRYSYEGIQSGSGWLGEGILGLIRGYLVGLHPEWPAQTRPHPLARGNPPTSQAR